MKNTKLRRRVGFVALLAAGALATSVNTMAMGKAFKKAVAVLKVSSVNEGADKTFFKYVNADSVRNVVAVLSICWVIGVTVYLLTRIPALVRSIKKGEFGKKVREEMRVRKDTKYVNSVMVVSATIVTIAALIWGGLKTSYFVGVLREDTDALNELFRNPGDLNERLSKGKKKEKKKKKKKKKSGQKGKGINIQSTGSYGDVSSEEEDVNII